MSPNAPHAPRRLERAWLLFPLFTTLHNLEEAIWLPAWSQTTAIHPAVSPFAFRFTVTVLSLAAWLITATAMHTTSRPARTMLFGYQAIMVVNVLLPHVAASLIERAYAPGVVTAVALQLPTGVYLLRRALREGDLTLRRLAAASIVAGGASLIVIGGLFALGSSIERVLARS